MEDVGLEEDVGCWWESYVVLKCLIIYPSFNKPILLSTITQSLAALSAVGPTRRAAQHFAVVSAAGLRDTHCTCVCQRRREPGSCARHVIFIFALSANHSVGSPCRARACYPGLWQRLCFRGLCASMCERFQIVNSALFSSQTKRYRRGNNDYENTSTNF